jgi:hypothetical protein
MGASLSTFFIMFSYELEPPPKEHKPKQRKPRQDFQNKPVQYNSKNMRKKHNIKQPGIDVQRRKQ